MEVTTLRTRILEEASRDQRKGSDPSAREQRKAAAAYGRLVKASCKSKAPGQLSLRVAPRGKGASLKKLLGGRAQAGIVRTAPPGATDGPNAQLSVKWHRG